jgi:hypothetical protein
MISSAETQWSGYPESRITPNHVQYFAHEVTNRCPSDTLQGIAWGFFTLDLGPLLGSRDLRPLPRTIARDDPQPTRSSG